MSDYSLKMRVTSHGVDLTLNGGFMESSLEKGCDNSGWLNFFTYPWQGLTNHPSNSQVMFGALFFSKLCI